MFTINHIVKHKLSWQKHCTWVWLLTSGIQKPLSDWPFQEFSSQQATTDHEIDFFFSSWNYEGFWKPRPAELILSYMEEAYMKIMLPWVPWLRGLCLCKGSFVLCEHVGNCYSLAYYLQTKEKLQTLYRAGWTIGQSGQKSEIKWPDSMCAMHRHIFFTQELLLHKLNHHSKM